MPGDKAQRLNVHGNVEAKGTALSLTAQECLQEQAVHTAHG
jgi:hypothetical protein